MKNIFINKTNNLTEEEQNTINAALDILSNKKATLNDDGEIVIPEHKINRIKVCKTSRNAYFQRENKHSVTYVIYEIAFTMNEFYEDLFTDLRNLIRDNIDNSITSLRVIINGHDFGYFDCKEKGHNILDYVKEVYSNFDTKEKFDKFIAETKPSGIVEGKFTHFNNIFDYDRLGHDIQQMQENMNRMFKNIFKGFPFNY